MKISQSKQDKKTPAVKNNAIFLVNFSREFSKSK